MRNGVQNSEYHTLAKAAATVLLFAPAVFNASPTFAQTLSEIARYDGADRTDRLVAGAKKEGALSFYSSSVAEDTAPVIDAFKKKYGVDVQVWRGSTETIIQRAVAEARAGRCPADAYHAGSPALEPLHREKLLLPLNSPATAAVMPQAAAAAWRICRHQRQLVCRRLQHQPGEAGRSPEILRGPEASPVE